MKKYFTMTALALGVLSQSAQAKIWRVNNNTGVNANYTSIQAAIDASTTLNGDTIHLEPSANNYGYCYLNKRLVIMGAGYFLTETSPLVANPKTQANTNVSGIVWLYCNPGSKGSVVSGLYMSGGTVIQDSLLTIQRCYMNSDVYFGDNGSSNSGYADTVRQNLISGGLRVGSNSGNSVYKNMLVYNNIFGSGIDFSQNINNTSGYIINNDFVYYYSTTQGNATSITSANLVYQNNIFGYVNFGVYQSSNVYFNNVCMGAGIPAGNSNVLNADVVTNVYKDWTGNGAGFSSDSRYQLKTGSNPAVSAGTINGTTIDCGAFGGPAPYILSGMPNAPSIYGLTVPTQINTGTNSMNITISSASH